VFFSRWTSRSTRGTRISRSRKRVPRFALDLSPLRYSREYRLLWFGQLVSFTGTQLRFVAIPYQVYVLTGSPLAVGLIGAFQAGPLIAFSVWGGVIADAVDRRRLLLMTQLFLACASAVLALGTQAAAARLWFVYLMTAVTATLSALDSPARASMIPTLVERADIPKAMALNQVLIQTGSVAGPALGGFVIARLGLSAAYWADAGSYVAAFIAVAMMRTAPRAPGGPRPGWGSLVEGLRFLRTSPLIIGTFVLDFIAMLFGHPRAMLPFYADRVFHTGAQGLGLLFAAIGAGALVGALSSGWVAHVRRQGFATLVCVAVWGAAIAAFGLAPAFPLALVLLAVAGAADVYSAIFRGTIVQTILPDDLRGRVTSVHLMVVVSGPQLGQVESGGVAALVSPRFSVVSGGLACLAGVALVAATIPALARYTPPEV
jgi:MFS family permease